MTIREIENAFKTKQKEAQNHDKLSKSIRKEMKADKQLIEEATAIAVEQNQIKCSLMVGKVVIDILGFNVEDVVKVVEPIATKPPKADLKKESDSDEATEAGNADSEKESNPDEKTKADEEVYADEQVFEVTEEFRQELSRLKLLAQFGEAVQEVAGFELAESNLAGFRKYALGGGRIYIINAIGPKASAEQKTPTESNPTATADTPVHGQHEQQTVSATAPEGAESNPLPPQRDANL